MTRAPATETRTRVRILAFDTATWTCAVALVDGSVVVAEESQRTESSHAETLPRMVASVLSRTGERLGPGDALAVSIGPGSFTGLRIGVSFAKGLAFAGGLRIVGVPTLDALALAALPWEGRLCAALDARKREVYAAIYEWVQGRVVRIAPPRALTASRLAQELGGPCTVVGDAVDEYGDVFAAVLGEGARLLSSARQLPRASALAQLAAARLARHPAGDHLSALAPDYLRPPEAELTQSVHSPSPDLALPMSFVDKVPLLY